MTCLFSMAFICGLPMYFVLSKKKKTQNKKKNIKHPVLKKRYANVTCTQEWPQQSNDIIADMQMRELEVQVPLRIV